MSRNPLSAERAQEIVRDILERDRDPAIAEALLELILGIMSPKSDPKRNAVAEEAARAAYTYTQSFEQSFKTYSAGQILADDEDEDDSQPS